MCLDRDAAAIDARPATRPCGGALPESLLYVLFTSGSSGRPKGVAMPHAPLVNLMRWQHERSGCGAGARTLQFAPYGFDVSCQELFATLGAGGTLVVVDDDTRLDPEALLEVLTRERVERVFMPFVALEQLAQAAVARDRVPGSLREVITAGEALRITPALAEMFGRLPGARLDDQYGPTECHVVSAHMLDGPPSEWPALSPIGRPVANAALHVLGAGGDPLPVGVAGELWVGGVPLARGYVGRPELTAERFVADHVSGVPGALLYRTGDLARWTADGCLEYLGRSDQQVKVRGYRVEPGEIEVALEQATAAVREAVVVAQEDTAGGHRLVAYLLPASEDRPDAAALRGALRSVLPEYMVPAAFQWIEA
ncbi:MAG TPA: AMP-binding protein, partial [Planctomycetota bacterium]|nr:AMP-binding protein [Planctomycetota bacterium]